MKTREWVLCVVVLGGLSCAGARAQESAAATEPEAWRGILEFPQSVLLRSEVEAPVAVVWVAPPSRSAVKKGDLVAELDSSAVRDEFERQQQELVECRAELDQAETGLVLARQEREHRIGMLEGALEAARLEAARARAEQALQRRASEVELSVAKARLALLEKRAAVCRERFESGVGDQEQRDRAELDLIEARAALEIGQAQHEYLVGFVQSSHAAASEAAMAQAEGELGLARRQADAAVRTAERALESRVSMLRRLEVRLRRLEEALAKCKLYAPVDGFVVSVKKGPDEETSVVYPRQAILELVDSSVAEFTLGESRVPSGLQSMTIGQSMAVGQPMTVRFDDLPGEEFKGAVSRVSMLAPGNPPRSKVSVALEQLPAEAHPRMFGTASRRGHVQE